MPPAPPGAPQPPPRDRPGAGKEMVQSTGGRCPSLERVTAAPRTRRGLRRRVAVGVLAPIVVVALALAGIVLGLRVASPGEYDTRLGRVSLGGTPAAHGQVEADVPPAGWGGRTPRSRTGACASTRSAPRCGCTSSRGPSTAPSSCARRAAPAAP